MKQIKFIDNVPTYNGIYLNGDKLCVSEDYSMQEKIISCNDNDKRPIRCSEFISLLEGQSYLTGGIKYINTIDTPIPDESIYDKSFYYLSPKDLTSNIPRIDIINRPGDESIVELVDGSVEVSPPGGDIKVCDSWNSSKINDFKDSLEELYKKYIDLEKPEEEIFDKIASRYSQNYFTDSYNKTISLVTKSSGDYTNQVDIREYIKKSTLLEIAGKLDITIEYLKSNNKYLASFSYTAFHYADSGSLIIEDRILISENNDVQGEYFNGIFTVYPLAEEISECIISDCILIYGKF